MIISVHQPHYLPWLGYLDKIDQSDVFVILDNVQYKKREFQNRNKIKTPQGSVWVTVPVQTRGKYEQMTCKVEIDNSVTWREKHLRMLAMSYSKAPYFEKHFSELKGFYQQDWNFLMDLSVEMTKYFLAALGIEVPVKFETELGVPGMKTERIVNICKALGADTYLSGSGAKAYLEEDRFEEAGLKLMFQKFKHPEYSQLHGDFIPYMAIVDLLFNYGNDSIEVIRMGRK